MLASLLLAEGFQPVVAFRLHRQAVASISQRATGLPSSPPATMPKVAEASAAVVAPWAPSPSATGPKAAAAPKPPSSDTAPAMIPSSGSRPSSPALPTPIRFCSIASAQQADR